MRCGQQKRQRLPLSVRAQSPQSKTRNPTPRTLSVLAHRTAQNHPKHTHLTTHTPFRKHTHTTLIHSHTAMSSSVSARHYPNIVRCCRCCCCCCWHWSWPQHFRACVRKVFSAFWAGGMRQLSVRAILLAASAKRTEFSDSVRWNAAMGSRRRRPSGCLDAHSRKNLRIARRTVSSSLMAEWDALDDNDDVGNIKRRFDVDSCVPQRRRTKTPNNTSRRDSPPPHTLCPRVWRYQTTSLTNSAQVRRNSGQVCRPLSVFFFFYQRRVVAVAAINAIVVRQHCANATKCCGHKATPSKTRVPSEKSFGVLCARGAHNRVAS